MTLTPELKAQGWRPTTEVTEDNPIPHGVSIEIRRIGNIDYCRVIEE